MKAFFQSFDEFENLAAQLMKLKRQLENRISTETGCVVFPGETDFLLLRTDMTPPDRLAKSLIKNSIPAVSYSKLPGYERIIKLFPKSFDKPDDIIRLLS